MNLATLHGIHPATILPNTRTGFNVFLSDRVGEHPIKFLASNQTVDQAECHQLRASAALQVFIEDTSLEAYHDYLANHASQWIADGEISRDLKASLLIECSASQWELVYATSDWKRMAQVAQQIGRSIAEFVETIGINVLEVIHTLGAGIGEVQHSLRTGIYSAVLGNALGDDRDVCSELCMGGLLHDVGKRSVGDDAELVSECGEKGERRVRNHPLIGFRRLCHVSGLPQTALLMCYQHHENLRGTGYPCQIVEGEIHHGAKICAIVDRYDHLTTNENPRLASSPAAAGRIMEQDKSLRFDPEMMKVWLKLLKNHLKNSSSTTP